MRRAVFLLAFSLLAACGKKAEEPAPPTATVPASARATLQVLATSDLKDIEPLAAQIRAATGVDVQFRFGGTMESTQEVLSGDSGDKPRPDAAWFANAKYLLSDAAGQGKVKLQE
jgi:Ca-activated chloride channel family protein